MFELGTSERREPFLKEGPGMSKTPKKAGETTFYTYAHLLNGARSLYQSALDHPEGSSHCRVSAVLFSAFAVEAYLNHIGEDQLPFWEFVERKLSWSDKLRLIGSQFGLNIEDGKRPFQTVKKVFAFRDKLAHGKTHHGKIDTRKRGEPPMDPEWLSEFTSDAAVKRALDDTHNSSNRCTQSPAPVVRLD